MPLAPVSVLFGRTTCMHASEILQVSMRCLVPRQDITTLICLTDNVRCNSSQVVNAQLFDLTADPREQHNLLQHGGAGGCCLSCTRASASNGKPCMSMTQDPAVMLNVDQPLRQSDVSISCGAAGRIPVPSRDPGPQQSPADESNTVVDRSAEVCCHLQRAATSFAGNNLRFFGRQP